MVNRGVARQTTIYDVRFFSSTLLKSSACSEDLGASLCMPLYAYALTFYKIL